MSHRGVEIVLGRLATDAAARRRFQNAPSRALQELLADGIELSPVERSALESLDWHAVERFAQTLDRRIQRASLTGER